MERKKMCASSFAHVHVKFKSIEQTKIVDFKPFGKQQHKAT